ncbi:Uncharacterised protein [Klebsiella pneumoniae]|uniref:Uncharacterized protein n=1 Tax=Klebsiella pneumoniae TaxID=573 RepID=A0A2X1QVJ9_KLEPN|nr:Uncharacterised protein [Klebsiella pneumoniae]
MYVVSRYTAAEAAATIDPRGRAIALSVVIAAGALLLIMPPVIGVTGTLGLLTALIAAFGSGGDLHADNPGFIAHPWRRRAGPFCCQRPAGCWRWWPGMAGRTGRHCCRAWRAVGGSGCRLAHCGG